MGIAMSCMNLNCLDEKVEREPAYKILWEDTMTDIKISKKSRELKSDLKMRKKQRDERIKELKKNRVV
jgi:hypothetical protein